MKNGIEKFFGKMAHTPVKDFSNLVVGFDLVYKVQSDAIVVDVLNILFQKKITAVAVINKDGKLVGNFSASDLRVIYVYFFICEYLNEITFFST